MPNIEQDPHPHYFVFVDTNILWTEDKKLSVSNEFDELWKMTSTLSQMTLAVPEVVLGELHFQQTTSARKIFETISTMSNDLSGITAAKYPFKSSVARIKKQVDVKLNKWLKSRGAIVVSTPVLTINWQALIDSSIWRIAPFEFHSKSKEPKTEKGFRDALILETVAHACMQAKPSDCVIFICNDHLLQAAANTRLKTLNNFSCFESLADFASHVKLTKENLTTEFVKLIANHARKKFYVAGDQNCVYFKNDIQQRIRHEFASGLVVQNDSDTASTSNIKPFELQIVHENSLIVGTTFIKMEEPKECYWTTRIIHRRLMKYWPADDIFQTSEYSTSKIIQIVGFDVKWNARVTATGQFRDTKYESISKLEATLVDASESNLVKYGFSE